MARKKKKKRSEADGEVPLSAMIDVTFLLLTYFIMTQTEVIEEAYISMNMVTPNPGKPPPVLPPTLDIHVLSDKYVALGRPYTSIEEFSSLIITYAENSPETVVNLKLSGKATTSRFVDLLDLLAQAKLQEKLNIAYLKDAVAD